MTLTRVNTLFTYRSTVGTTSYLFDIQLDEQGNLTVKSIRTGSGLSQGACNIPQSILDEVQEAVAFVQDSIAETNVASGTLVFTGETVQAGVIAPGVLNNTAYRIAYTSPDNVSLSTDNKTVTSFDANTSVSYGSVALPKSVDFVVFVATYASSTTGGTLTFTDADAGTIAVAFASAMESDDYRVILTPGGFFDARILPGSRTRLGFTIEIGITLGAAEGVDVGYDVFVG